MEEKASNQINTNIKSKLFEENISGAMTIYNRVSNYMLHKIMKCKIQKKFQFCFMKMKSNVRKNAVI